MRISWAAFAPAVLCSAVLWAADPAGPAGKGLVVHEWGVFTAHDDIDVANADIRAEWDSLPDFMYGRIKGRALPVNWGPLEIRKRPVIFFHSQIPVDLKVRVSFPGGRPGLWWPGAQTPVARGLEQPAPTDFLEWRLGVRRPPAGFQARQPAPPVEKGHWVETLRAVKCDEVFAVFGEQALDCDRERFVYYDGIFPQGKWINVTVAGDAVGLANRTRHPVFDVMVVDRRTAGKVRVGRLARLDAGAEVRPVDLAAVDAAGFADKAADVLLGQLTAAGLNTDEARALVAFRKEEFFATAGVQVFYRIPQEEYDRLLPLTITPRPDKTVRVGLVLHPHCEPDLAERVLELVKQMDAEDFAKREAALARLTEMGPAVLVHLERLRKGKLPAEVRSRIELVLEKFDTRRAFPSK